jgi:acyl carrier protein phosphodiesterase
LNFLAHAYLSFGEPKVLIGNYIGDFVRGDLTKTYDPEIIIGVKLHRAIDAYTDTHPEVKKAQALLKPVYARYSSVITDMYFDHFLSKYWDEYHPVPIEKFAQEVYSLLKEHQDILPTNFLAAFEMMTSYNWLVSYGSIEGIRDAMSGVAKRTTFNSKMETAHIFLQENYEVLEKHFREFFPQLVEYSQIHLEELKVNV